ncbi:MAG: MFS transporter [Candidatus Bipolaricaulota bacterium]|nr:MFS transporter [Candidatus Bipolaricaulota bacterium]
MPSRSNERLVLLITSLASFLTPFMSSSVNVALPAIGREFSVSAVALGWVATSFLLAAAVGLVPIGRLADLRGRRRVFTTGLVVYTAGSFLCALAPSHLVLIAFRVVQGSGGAMIFGTATALLTSTFPASGRGRALGWNVASVYTGLSLGPFLGGILTQNLGWRSLFLTNVPLGVVILSLALWGMKEEKVEPQGASFDAPGALIYGAGLVALMIGFSTLPRLRSFFLLLSGIVGLVAFALRQMRAQSPLLDLRLFLRNRTLTLSNLAALINYSATAAVGFLLSLYLQYNRLLGPQAAGLVLVTQPVLQALLSPVAGRLSDRVQPRVVASIGMSMTVVGLALFAFLSAESPLVLVVLNLAWLGVSFALFSSPNTNAVMSAVDRRAYGVAAGTLATMRTLGQMFSLGIAMLLFSVFIGDAAIGPANALRFLTAARVACGIFSALCLVGVFASCARGNVPNR